jgi:hypothetical protein
MEPERDGGREHGRNRQTSRRLVDRHRKECRAVENSLEIYAPGDRLAFPSTSSGITVTGNRLSFTPNSGFEYAFCFRKGIYGWKVSGRSLAFTKVSDKCPARTAFLTGVWKRS